MRATVVLLFVFLAMAFVAAHEAEEVSNSIHIIEFILKPLYMIRKQATPQIQLMRKHYQ